MTTFKIEVSENRVDVRSADAGPRLTISTLWVALFCFGIGAYVLHEVLPLLVLLVTTHSADLWRWLLVVGMTYFGFVFVWQGLRQAFPSGESLVCDKGTLTISRIPDYVLNGKWKSLTFPINAVKQITFTTVRMGRYGGTTGLAFFVNRKKYKVLYGLESPEAQTVLKGLSNIGVDTIQDPGMTMMVEMALERRKSRFWRWV